MPPAIDRFAIWFAGFFDGEGAIMIAKFKRHDTRSDNPQYTLRLDVGSTDLSILQHIKQHFDCGHITQPHGQLRFPNSKPCYHWVATDRTAAKVLKRLLPYLVLKKERADLALAFQDNRHQWQRNNNGVNRLSKDEIERRELIYQKMKTLNKKGIHAEEE